MVRKVGRAALLVAALMAIPIALDAVSAGAAHAQTAPICLTVPASNTVTCFDEFGNPISQFPNPATLGAPLPVATSPTTVLAPSIAALGTTACFIDQFGNLICPPVANAAPVTQPIILTPLEPQSAQPQIVLPQAGATTGQSCFVNLDGSISCV